MVCTRCQRDLPETDEHFYFRKGRGKHVNPCRKCRKVIDKERRADPVVQKRYYELHIKRNYGLSLAEYRAKATEQGSKCEICRAKTKLYVDHCHRTGRVRDLLCRKCNLILGQLDDNQSTAKQLVKYLEKHHVQR